MLGDGHSASSLPLSCFGAIDLFNAPRIAYLLQRYVTKGSRVGALSVTSNWQTHKEYLKKYSTIGQIFEFDLDKTNARNLYLSDVAEKQIVIDLNPMIDLNLLENVRYRIESAYQVCSVDDWTCSSQNYEESNQNAVISHRLLGSE